MAVVVWYRFRKASFFNFFPSTPSHKTGVFKFLWFEERFRKSSVFVTDKCG